VPRVRGDICIGEILFPTTPSEFDGLGGKRTKHRSRTVRYDNDITQRYYTTQKRICRVIADRDLTPHEHMWVPKNEGGWTVMKRQSSDDFIQRCSSCSCARPLIYSTTAPKSTLAKKLLQSNRPNRLLNRQRPKYPSVRTVHSRRERRHDAELDELRAEVYVLCGASQQEERNYTHAHHQLRQHEQYERYDAVPRCCCGAEGRQLLAEDAEWSR
jgi:hypothetical protein